MKNKFKIININKVNDFNDFNRDKLNKKFNFITDDDLYTSSALIQSRK